MNPTKWHQLDIAKLAPFELPSTVCQDCRAISRTVVQCIYCNGPNVIELNAGRRVTDRYRHAINFAIAVPLRERVFNATNAVAEVISFAELYIHFATFSIDLHVLELIEGALRRGVQISGLVGQPNKYLDKIKELNKRYQYICKILTFTGNSYDDPHQKILIAYGCVAITGSMNLTKAGFEKHERNPPSEFIWAFTDIDSVVAINNEYISTFYVRPKSREQLILEELEAEELVASSYPAQAKVAAVVAPLNPNVMRCYRNRHRKAIVKQALNRLAKPGPHDPELSFGVRRKIYKFLILAEIKGFGRALIAIRVDVFDCINVIYKRRYPESRMRNSLEEIGKITLEDFELVEQTR